MPKFEKTVPTQTKDAPKKSSAMANPKNADSRKNLDKVFGKPKK